MNRQGNNFHPDLPPCPRCGSVDWTNNDVHMGHGIQAFYSCATAGCDGRAKADYLALGTLVLFEAPIEDDGCYRVPRGAAEWIRSTKQALASADINACVHGGKDPPAAIVTPPASGDGLLGTAELWDGLRRGLGSSRRAAVDAAQAKWGPRC